jgi:DNA polymerase III delta prime subunit
LFSGSPGTGKTTLAKILVNALNIHPYDLMEINASREGKIEVLRDKITAFLQTMPFGNLKVVLLDEADYLTQPSQAALRGMLEEYSDTARFVLTCNYDHKIIPAIKSRCQGFHIEKLDITEFTARMAEILLLEQVQL